MQGKKVSEDNGLFNSEVAAQHLKQYYDDHGYTKQVALANDCKLERKTIQHLLSGRHTVYRKSTFSQIAEKLGAIAEYWQGITSAETLEEYQQELQEKREYEQAEYEALDGLLEFQKAEVERRTTLFYTCGYRYECLEGTAAYDFASIVNPSAVYADKPHVLTRYTEPETHYYFSDAEFKNLKEQITHTIDFACFANGKAQAAAEKQQGKQAPTGGQNGGTHGTHGNHA